MLAFREVPQPSRKFTNTFTRYSSANFHYALARLCHDSPGYTLRPQLRHLKFRWRKSWRHPHSSVI